MTSAVLSAAIKETLSSVVFRSSYGISDTYINAIKFASILWTSQAYISYSLQRKLNAKFKVRYPAVLSKSVTQPDCLRNSKKKILHCFGKTMSILGQKEALAVASTCRRNIKNGIHKKEAKIDYSIFLG